MSDHILQIDRYKPLVAAFGERLLLDIPLARLTSARLGGKADLFVEALSVEELVQLVEICWQNDLPFTLLGGGSNVLVSDAGVRGLVILNKAKNIQFLLAEQESTVWAESGANFGLVARQAAQHGLSGLEWAAGIPGSVGGAVVGNAGAHGGDMAGNLVLAEILHLVKEDAGGICRREKWSADKFAYAYRNSILKRQPGDAVVLAALLRLETSSVDLVMSRMDEITAYRKRTQPPGASMGSMFKNPPGDYAGRLIEAAGLKGKSFGNVQISPVHANFFINNGQAKACDVYHLINLAQEQVLQQFGVHLELEIELVGEWQQAVCNE